MDIYLYIMIWIMGTVFGSFFTLAVYRIPLKKDITHERSFCPKCNHRLEFLDMIPVFSYLLLRGKCRYCGDKIRIRYFLLEILSGIVFLLGYISLNMHFPFWEISKFVYFISFIGMYITLAIIAGIDKEYRRIHQTVLLFGEIIQGMYILYLYKLGEVTLFPYLAYGIIFIALFIIDMIRNQQAKENTYVIQILMLMFYLNLCIGSYLCLVVMIGTILGSIAWNIMSTINFQAKDKADILQENERKQIPVGFLMAVTAIAVTIIENFLIYCK